MLYVARLPQSNITADVCHLRATALKAITCATELNPEIGKEEKEKIKNQPK